MKQEYPVRHPPVPEAAVSGETTPARHQEAEPRLPHEHDESSHSQAQATPDQKAVGTQAYRNATDGTTDTDKGPLMDEIYNGKVASDRGTTPPRQ